MQRPCALCGDSQAEWEEYLERHRCECRVCGRYNFDPTELKLDTFPNLHKIAAYVAEYGAATLTPDNCKNILEAPEKSIEEKLDRLLETVETWSPFFGFKFRTEPQLKWPKFHAKTPDEMVALINLADEQGLIKCGAKPTIQSADATLTAAGHARLRLARQTNKYSDRVFVAMWFNKSIDPIYWDHIDPGIRSAGYKPVRIDLEEYNDLIVGRIMTEIRQSRFVVCDFTGHRNGVYFEAGFAKGLGLDVIWLCRADEIEKAHFDTNHFNHIAWGSDGTLAKKLCDRILMTVGAGPHYIATPIQ